MLMILVFLTFPNRQWDGLLTATDSRILVLGATNRPNDIDPAILRRMPKRFAIRLPDRSQRLKILQLMLKDTPLSPTLSLDLLAAETDGLSGSDLHELCRNAAMHPLKELIRRDGGLTGVTEKSFALRPLTLRDFLTVDSDSLPPPGTNDPVALPNGQANGARAAISELEEDDLS
jgi:SpoVK/Ycf46/Vps4 family AAA+-type ATPase